MSLPWGEHRAGCKSAEMKTNLPRSAAVSYCSTCRAPPGAGRRHAHQQNRVVISRSMLPGWGWMIRICRPTLRKRRRKGPSRAAATRESERHPAKHTS